MEEQKANESESVSAAQDEERRKAEKPMLTVLEAARVIAAQFGHGFANAKQVKHGPDGPLQATEDKQRTNGPQA